LKYDAVRQFYIRLAVADLEDRQLPEIFTNVVRNKQKIEFQTLELMKRNQKIIEAHQEVLLLSGTAVQDLIVELRGGLSKMFKICEGVAMLDMISSFAQLVTIQDYVRPQLTDTLAIKSGRHPIREKIHGITFVPNDVYATQQTRFQIITGCNMSGKSTYIRSIALMSVMAQIGCFVPAQYASFPLLHQLFARVSLDDSIEANVSTFAAEMRETAFIIRNVHCRSIVIVDELGRGTSTRDGLAIALAIAEALVNSRALVWFVTHFRDLAMIMAERTGVVNLHLSAEISREAHTMTMLYKVEEGPVQESHYGLAIARVLPFPTGVVDRADEVAAVLEKQSCNTRSKSVTLIRERRRKLILNLREHLVQASNGAMEGEALASWLKELQREFVIRMTAINEEVGQSSVSDELEESTAEDEMVDPHDISIDSAELSQQSMGDTVHNPLIVSSNSSSSSSSMLVA
jgi:DNA mismatch repair protein MSH4